jgi:small-conductance mechanosensitive channel
MQYFFADINWDRWSETIWTHALRVDGFDEFGVQVKVLGETQPSRQWDVMGELRKRVKKAFDGEGIEIRGGC